MDSPEKVKATTTSNRVATSSDSPPVQESPFSNFLSNLSPIKPVKAAHVPQGFLGLSSPPVVFTSPRILSDRETSFLQRTQCPQISREEISKNNNGSNKFADGPDALEKSITYLSSRSISDTQKNNNTEKPVLDQTGSSSGCLDDYLSDPVEVDSENTVNLVNPYVKQSGDVIQSWESGLTNLKKITLESDSANNMRLRVDESQNLSEQANEDSQEQPTLAPMSVKIVALEEQSCSEQPSNECGNFKSELPVDHVSRQQECHNLEAQIVQAYEDKGEDVGAGPVPEASQLQRGISRRCLLFEGAQWKTTTSISHSPNPTNNVTGSRSPASTTELKILDSSQVDMSLSSSKNEIMAPLFPSHNSGRSPLSMPKPSGIGLHLNSIVNTLPIDHSAKPSNLVEKVLMTAEDSMVETTKASLATSSITSGTFHRMESLDMMQPPIHQVTPQYMRKANSDHADNFEKFNQPSPNKKRKKSLSIDGDGCKRCNCKKTKCLKLYCDCFAAGIYCAEPCACQGCFNRPEYEDTVLETRQLIESRNPLAFAPKIVLHTTELAATNGEDGNRFTPSSARHKRGCNCKRSMCLKKYCECYQANVGCSNGCRCEGCKNIYGRKEEYGTTEIIVNSRASDERLESTVDDKMEMLATNKDFLHSELYDLHNLTPLTPSIEYSGYVLSPESRFPMFPSGEKSTRSPRYSHSNDMLPQRSKKISETGSFGRGMDYNIAEMGQFSPRCHAVPDMSDLTPLPNPSSMTTASSASSRTREWINVSRIQLGHGSSGCPSGSSLRWRSSPITPMTRLGETKNQPHDPDCGLYNILEDDTSDTLKEAPTPIASVKVSSPNKKRVSPSHGLRSSSSGGLKSGCKFILRAVPSFPPLSPCMDSTDKDSTNQKP